MFEESTNNSNHAASPAISRAARPSPAPADEHADGHAIPTDLPRIPWWGVSIIVIVLLVMLAGLFLLGWIPHQRKLAAAQEAASAAASSVPVVEVVKPRAAPGEEKVSLPGDAKANQMTAVYARTDGYLKTLPPGIDIGATVAAGQLIAEIAAPEVDAQLEQARASLEQSRAAVKRAEEEHTLAATTLRRYEDPGLGNAIAKQDVDTRRSQEGVAAAALSEARINVKVAEAAVKRLEDLQGFTRVLAPFAGVITARNYDAGALITASDTNKPLFVIEQVDVLRVAVSVPQAYSSDIRVGQAGEFVVANMPGKVFAGTVARTSGSLDPATRTLRVDVDVPNPDRALMPGAYGQVRLVVHRARPALILPTSAMVFGPAGMTIAVLENGVAKTRVVTLGRDFGAEAEVLTGLAASDVVINNPGLIADGTRVEVKAAERPTK